MGSNMSNHLMPFPVFPVHLSILPTPLFYLSIFPTASTLFVILCDAFCLITTPQCPYLSLGLPMLVPAFPTPLKLLD